MLKETLIILIGICGLLILYYKYWFLRNPEISVPKGKNIMSPATGKILKVMEINKDKIEIKKGFLGKIKILVKDITKEGYFIPIVMSLFDVHYQKAPIDGVVTKVKHSKGKFLNAVFGAESMDATFENEKNEIVIEGEKKVKVIQIAGMFARRIVCFVKEGDKVKKGQDIGLIKFGSQVVLVIPKTDIKVKDEQKVKTGETIIAKYK